METCELSSPVTCYFCGRGADHEHHVLPVAISEGYGQLSEGSFEIKSVKKVYLCDECHVKFHKLVHPLRLLGLLETRVFNVRSPNAFRDRVEYVWGTIRLLQEQTGYGSVSLQKLHEEFDQNFSHEHLEQCLAFLEKNGFIYQPRPQWFKLTTSTEKQAFHDLEKIIKTLEPNEP